MHHIPSHHERRILNARGIKFHSVTKTLCRTCHDIEHDMLPQFRGAQRLPHHIELPDVTKIDRERIEAFFKQYGSRYYSL